MRKWIFWIVTLHINLLAAQSGCTKGDSLVQAQNFMAASVAYQYCVQSDSNNTHTQMALADCWFQLGDFQQAKILYLHMENDSIASKTSIQRLANIYEMQQNLPIAIKYITKLSQLYPLNPTYYRKLATLYLQGNEQTQAMELYKQAHLLNRRDILTIQGLVELFLSINQVAQADSMVKLGMEIDSMNIGLSLLSARIQYKQRNYEQTARTLDKLTLVTELNSYYNKMLGYSFLQIDSLDKSIYHLQKSLQKEGDPENALFYLAIAYEKKKDFETSIHFYNEAAKEGISENMSQYYRGLARIFTHKGDTKSVIENYKKSLEYQIDPSVYYYLGNASEQYYKNKSIAIKYYQQYIEHQHNNSEWNRIANERIRLLKEQTFMSKTQ